MPVAKKLDPLALARKQQAKQLKSLRKRERLAPALAAYDEVVADLQRGGTPQPHNAGLAHLTSIFRGNYATVLSQIEAAGKTGISLQNSVKRTAGTNFQGLCEYSLILWAGTTNLPICIAPNAPRQLRDELTIHGVDVGGPFSVEPDIDLCIWEAGGAANSPLLFVSAKTSLVDRAGQAARWKLYLDLHQTTCPHTKTVLDCPIHKTEIRVHTQHPIHHSIVTANIYKIDTTHPHGELNNGQCRNNTYMFAHRYSTRNDANEIRPAGWQSFGDFPSLVEEIFSYTLPSAPGSLLPSIST